MVLACVVALLGVLLAGGVAVARDYTGTPGPDEIRDTSSRDIIEGLGGNDRIFGGGDTLKGGTGDDYIKSKDGRSDTVDCGCETVRLDGIE